MLNKEIKLGINKPTFNYLTFLWASEGNENSTIYFLAQYFRQFIVSLISYILLQVQMCSGK